MKFRSEISLKASNLNIYYSDNICLMGSCFSDHIGRKLQYVKFNALNNPLGIVFNPISLAKQLDYILGYKEIQEKDWVEGDGLWHHFDFHGKFSHPDRAFAHQSLSEALDKAKGFISKTSILFLTLGTAQVFQLKSSGQVVANNHKFPIDQFIPKRLKTDEIVEAFSNVVEKLVIHNERIKLVFSISPVRYLREGFEANQRSKATMLMAIDQLQDDQTIHYFPSYEIFMDDLRDYRYYNRDMIHPADEGISYVWEKFSDLYFDEKTKTTLAEIEQLIRSIYHRPIHPASRNHLNFRKKLLEKCLRLKEKYDFLDWSEELAKL